MRLLNLRVGEDLMLLIAQAVAASGRPTMSEWARDALEAGARQELRELERVEAARALNGSLGTAGRSFLQPSGCQHPPQAQYVGIGEVTCLLCGENVRRT